MSERADENPYDNVPVEPPSGRPQFGLRTMFVFTGAYALLFAALRGLGLAGWSAALVGGLATLSIVAALLLVWFLAKTYRNGE